MNYRALALGAAIGFLFALSPSCGTPKKCDATNCAGCCDTAGACQVSSAAACGASGQACVACGAGQTCAGGTCTTSGTGGGTGTDCRAQGKCPKPSGGCGENSCTNGCCIPNDPLGQCSTAALNSLCGANGDTCAACSPSQQCGLVTGGTACQAGTGGGAGGGSGGTDAGIGTPCSANLDCGAGFICKLNTTDLSDGGTYTTLPDGGAATPAAYPGGFCTKICTSSQTCGGGGNQCIFFQASNETERVCAPACSGTGPTKHLACRDGYSCYTLNGGANVCWIDPPFENGKIGGPCARDEDCGLSANAYCEPATNATNQSTPYPGGYCTAACTAANQQQNPTYCGANTNCVRWSSIDPRYNDQCYSQCSNPDGGSLAIGGVVPGGCRAGQLCWDLFNDTDTFGVCAGDCQLSTETNKGCPGGTACVNETDGGDTRDGMCCVTDGGTRCFALIP